ncbi:MAG0480 family ComEC-like protein [Mycoplasma sp. 480]|uniref:MAG0480 family ComEC-like protein n=1 Tax=Mycoplasma sp. 480 TaxID=3440155 RepID=UPI003F51477A
MGRFFKNKWIRWKNSKNSARRVWDLILLIIFIIFLQISFTFLNYLFLFFNLIIFIYFLNIKSKLYITFLILFTIYFFILFFSQNSEKKTFVIEKNNIQFYKLSKKSFFFDFESRKVLINYPDIQENALYNAKLEIEKIENNNEKLSWNLFLKSKNILYKVQKVLYLNFQEKHFSFLDNIKQYILSGKENYAKIVPMLLIGEKTNESNEIVKIIKDLSIYHLFVISGFHIGLINLFIKKIFNFLKIKEIWFFIFFFFFCFVYLMILDFSISSVRAFVFIIFNYINLKLLKNKFNRIEILIFIALIFIIININVIFSVSFILTFLITLNILFILEFKIKNKFLNILLISISSNIIGFLIINIVDLTHYNILSILNSVVFSPIISILYIFSFIFIWNKEILDFISLVFIYIIKWFYPYQYYINLNFSFIISLIVICNYFLILNIINFKKNKEKG